MVLLGQARTTTLIVSPHSSPADPREKKAMGPFGPGLRRKNAALSLQLWVPESWNQQLRSWQPPWRLGQPPPWSHGPRHSVLCDSSLAGWTEPSTDKDASGAPRAPCPLCPQHARLTWSPVPSAPRPDTSLLCTIETVPKPLPETASDSGSTGQHTPLRAFASCS